MTESLVFRILGMGLIAGVVGFAITTQSDREDGLKGQPGRQRYLPYFPAASLPMVLMILFLFPLFIYGFSHTIFYGFSSFFGIFIHISLYYALLMCALPFLRKHFTARTCAALWMLPNILYLTLYSFMEVNMPLWVLQIPTRAFTILIGIWTAGFAGVLLWQICAHLRFCNRILKGAEPITEPEILDLWQQELTDTGIKKPGITLLRSPQISTPLSLGFSVRSARVLLPEKTYNTKELTLIFRHELVHICRQDASTKFFLAFCTAICWFNPLIWIAYRKSAEDMELGCDETVLLDAQEAVRRQYADLILTTAGDDRGFTTCLSASANSLRYRLKNIVKPRQLQGGAMLCAVVCFLLCISCGYVAIALGPETGQDALFHGDPSHYKLDSIHSELHLDPSHGDTLTSYLSGLQLYPISGNYTFEGEGTVNISYNSSQDFLFIDVFDRYLVVHRRDAKQPKTVYYVPDGIDFDHLNNLSTCLPAS